MHYDVVIIGAGLSGLAAGVRCAYFDRRVCIVERHYAYGGLNSYYTRAGRPFDVGLHAMTNFVPPGVRGTPLARILGQLRLSRDELDLCEHRFSEVVFPGRRLRFTNDVTVLVDEVAREFPKQVDGFNRLVDAIRAHSASGLDSDHRSAREVLGTYLSDGALVDMLLCPTMFYGSAQEHDIDFLSFVILFKSLFLEGFARPRGGVRSMLKTLVRKFRACGGKLKMRCGVTLLDVRDSRVARLNLDTGETLTADVVLSCAGAPETLRLCSDGRELPHLGPKGEEVPSGRVSFMECIAVSKRLPQAFGHEAAIVFFNDADRFAYARPDDLVDLRSGLFCCPSNYERHDDMPEGIVRVTWQANYDRWAALDKVAYAEAKDALREDFLGRAERFTPGIRDDLVFVDMFTPLTIERFTGRRGGAVYGTPQKLRDGRTRIGNLFLCGTDQGYLGIIGAMLSGITMANMHVLAHD